jgi:hypothetical protein
MFDRFLDEYASCITICSLLLRGQGGGSLMVWFCAGMLVVVA